MNKLPFDQIKQIHERAKSDGSRLGQMSLAEFSQFMQDGDSGNDWSEGLKPDNWVGGLSRGIDSLVEKTGLPDLAAQGGGAVGQLVDNLSGQEQPRFQTIGEEVGRGLPRMAADISATMGGFALLPTPAAPLGAGLIAAGTADAGIKGYEETGSVKGGVLSAGMNIAAPGVSRVGSKLGLKMLPKALASSPMANVVASEVGQQSAFMGLQAGHMALMGENPFTVDNMFANALGIAAFSPLSVHQGVKVYKGVKARNQAALDLLGNEYPLIQRPGTTVVESNRPGDTPTPVKNNMAKLMDYLLGDPDADTLPEMLQDKTLVQVLEQTGLMNAKELSTREQARALKGRRAAKKLFGKAELGSEPERPMAKVAFFDSEAEARAALASFPEGSTIDQTGGAQTPKLGPKGGRTKKGEWETGKTKWRVRAPEEPSIVSSEAEALAQEIAPLVGSEPQGVVDMLRIVQAANKFQTKFARGLDEQQGFRVANEKQTTKGKVRSFGYEDEGAKYGVRSDEVNPMSPEEVARETEFAQAGLGEPKPLVGMRPKAVKGKQPVSLEDRLKMPAQSRLSGGDDLKDSHVFRFVRGELGHDGQGFTKLGNTAVPKTGVLHENRFQSATQMPKQVFELVKQVYPEAWDGENVNVNKLRELEKSRPLMETHVYGQAEKGSLKGDIDRLIGELDILGIHTTMAANEGEVADFVYRGQSVHQDSPNLPPGASVLMDSIISTGYRHLGVYNDGPTATSYYDTISPFDTTKYPVVRIDVTVPLRPTGEQPGPRYAGGKSESQTRGVLWGQDNLHENLPNTLGWAMVQFVPHPRTGETVMFVAEQQSRWGQTRARYSIKTNGDKFDVWYKPTDRPAYVDRSGFTDKETAQRHVDAKVAPHDLLDLQHRLVLKAAMDEARKRGVTKMVVSDGETAMMTEKHDTIPDDFETTLPDNWQASVPKGYKLRDLGDDVFEVVNEKTGLVAASIEDNFVINGTPEMTKWLMRITELPEPSQAGGMRQHYDSVLQSAAEKQTGTKGVPVDMGPHKNAATLADMDVIATEDMTNDVVGSPVFRNPDGTPKATATGKMYDIPMEQGDIVRYSKVAPGQDKRGVYTRKTISDEIGRLSEIEDSPEVAVQRFGQMVQNKLRSAYEFLTGKNDGLNQARRMMSEAYDNLGLHPENKPDFMAAVDRIVKTVGPEKAIYGSTEAFKRAGTTVQDYLKTPELIRGIYFGEENGVAVNTNMELRRHEAGAFDLLSTLAHESIHGLVTTGLQNGLKGVDSYRGRAAKRMFEYSETLDTAQRQRMLRHVYENMIPEQFRQSDRAKRVMEDWVNYHASDPMEFMVEYSAMVTLAKVSSQQKMNYLRFVPEPIQDFMRAVYRGIDELKQVIFAAVPDIIPGGEEGFKRFHRDVEQLLKRDQVVESARESVAKALQAPAALENGDVGGMNVRLSRVGLKAADTLGQEVNQIRFGNGFTRSVFQHAQTAFSKFYKETLPEYGRVVSSLMTMDGLAVSLQHAMRKDFMVQLDGGMLKALASLPDSKLTPEQLRQKSMFARVQDSPQLQRAAYDSMLKMNELVHNLKGGESYPTFEHPAIQEIVGKLEPGQRADVQHVFETYLTANRRAAKLQIDTERQRLHYVGADYLFGAGVPHEHALKLGADLVDGLVQGKVYWEIPPNPELGVEGVLGGTIHPELKTNSGALAMKKHWERVQPAYETFRDYLDRPYFTEFRSGRWGIRYEVQTVKPDGTVETDTGYRSTNDRFQLKAIQRDILSDPRNRILEIQDHKKDPKSRFGQMQTRGLEEAISLVRAHYEASMSNIRPDLAEALRTELDNFDPGQPLVRKVNESKQTLAARRLAPGREKINMIAAQDAYSSLLARKLANSITRWETNWQMKSAKWDADLHLKNEIQSFRDRVLNAGAQEFQGFRKVTTLLTMGGNVSSAMVDATQPITMGLWRATAEIGFTKALGYTMRGFKEAFVPVERLSDKTFAAILTEASNRGFLKTGGSLDNFLTADDAINYNVLKAQNNRDLVDMKTMLTDREFLAQRVFEQFSALSDKGMYAAMTPMRLSAQMNNKNSLWVGYQMGKDRGLTGSALSDYAINFMQTVNLQGQRAAHSSFKLKAGEANELVGAATLLTNYPIAVFSQMHSNWISALKSSGLPAEVRRRSAQALAGQILTQMTFAGMSGLGLGALFSFVREMFGYDPEQLVREGAAAIDESGTLGEVLLNGVMNQVTGIDLASRFDLGGLGGFNPYTGFDAKGLFGAGGGVISALYNMPGQIAKGDISKMNFIPTGARRMLTAFSDDAYQDSSGQTIIDPTTAEKFGMMLGFKPARFAEAMRQKRTMREVEQSMSDRNVKEKQQMFDMLKAGEVPKVMQMVQDRVARQMQGVEIQDMSPYKLRQFQEKLIREDMMELVNYSVEKALPIDPLLTGSGETGQAKQAAAQRHGNLLAPRATEQDRTKLKYNMLEQLGVKPTVARTKAIRKAMMVDEVLRQNPTLTRSQAIALVEANR